MHAWLLRRQPSMLLSVYEGGVCFTLIQAQDKSTELWGQDQLLTTL